MAVKSRLWDRRHYLLALLVTVSTVCVRLLLESVGIGGGAPFFLFALAILVSAWAGGFGPGLLSSVLCYLSIHFFFMEPRYSFALYRPGDIPMLIMFLVEGVLISYLCQARLNALAALQRSHEESVRQLVESIRDYAIIKLDPLGRVVSWNSGAERTKGYKESEILGQHFSRFYPIEDIRSGKPEHELRVAAETGRFEDEGWRVRKDSSRYWANVVITAIRDADGRLVGYSKITRDITERRRAEEALRERESMLRGLFESAPDAVLVVRPDGRIERVNAQAGAMFGYRRDEMLNEPLERLVPERFRGEHERHREAYRHDAHTRPMGAGLDLYGLRKDSREFPVDIMLSPVGTSHGLLTIAVVRDITERKNAEEALKALNLRLQISNRELQDFASVASHDLQEPLRKIQAFGDRLVAKCSHQIGPEGLDYLQRMQNAAGRMRALIEDLLTFSRVTTRAQPFQKVDLNQIAREVLSDMEATVARTHAQIKLGDMPAIEADPTQMRQLLQNLISNAVKFSRPDTAPVVEVKASVDGANGGGRRVRLTIQDNGIGFEEKYLDRIFNVFQRLHGRGVYEGTGIGLAVCRKIVERHHGSITARSLPGEGSAFIVNLPVHQPDGGLS